MPNTPEEGTPMTRQEAYEKGYYTISRELISGPTFAWTDEDWMKAVTYTVPIVEESELDKNDSVG